MIIFVFCFVIIGLFCWEVLDDLVYLCFVVFGGVYWDDVGVFG